MKLRILLPVLVLAVVSAQAADMKFGVHAGLSLPQGKVNGKNYLDGQMGFTLGGSLRFDLGKGHAITPRIDIASYSKDKGEGLEYNVTNTTVGADYNYFINGKVGEGFYLIGGIGYAQVKHEVKGSFGPYTVTASDTPNALQLALGAGYHFNQNWHGEFRYTSVEVEPKFGVYSEKIDCPAINLTVGFRF